MNEAVLRKAIPIDTHHAAVTLVPLPAHRDARGGLSVLEHGREIPFPVERVYFIYDVPGSASRAGHAHRSSQTLLAAAAGSFEVHVDDGSRTATYRLDRRSGALLIPARVWLEVDNFDAGAVCLALSSHLYDEDDYWTDHREFRKAVQALD